MYQPNVELCSEDLIKQIISVADPVFSRGGAPTPKIAIIFQFVAENCMKMKEFGPPGGGASLAPPWICQCIYMRIIPFF